MGGSDCGSKALPATNSGRHHCMAKTSKQSSPVAFPQLPMMKMGQSEKVECNSAAAGAGIASKILLAFEPQIHLSLIDLEAVAAHSVVRHTGFGNFDSSPERLAVVQ